MSHRLVNLTELRARAERAIARSRERGEPTPADAEQFEGTSKNPLATWGAPVKLGGV